MNANNEHPALIAEVLAATFDARSKRPTQSTRRMLNRLPAGWRAYVDAVSAGNDGRAAEVLNREVAAFEKRTGTTNSRPLFQGGAVEGGS